jgi:tetratricopeptide (TPR) repeat protein
VLSNQEGYARAREAAQKAPAIDPGYALAHASSGWIAMYGANDPAAAAPHFERALALSAGITQTGESMAALDSAQAALSASAALD